MHPEYFAPFSNAFFCALSPGYAGNNDGLVGITTSPIIERVNPLRYLNYNT